MIELKNIGKSFFNNSVLENISLKLPSKGMFFIVGRSGSGKSTLLNLIGGLDRPSSGEIIINGKNTSSFKNEDWDEYRNNNVGFIFQEYYLQEGFSVKENLLLPLELQMKGADKEEKIKSALKSVNLSGFEKRTVVTLSGGEKQRVSIARAIIKNPWMLLADEPTGALDSKSGHEVFKILQKISKDKLVLVVSHDLGFAKEYGEGMIELSDGKIVSNNLPDCPEVLSNTEYPKKKKQHISLRETLVLAWHYLHEKPFRLVLSIILSVTSLSLFGLFDSLATVDKLDVAANSLIASGDESVTVKARANGHPSLCDEDIDKLKDETGLSLSGATDFTYYNNGGNSYIITSNYLPASFSGFYFQFFPRAIHNGVSFKDIGCLPGTFSLLAGDYPSEDNQIVLTDYQYELFHKGGFLDKNNDGSLIGISKPKDLLNKTIGSSPKCTICGVLDTDFDMEHFKPYLDFLEYNKDGNESMTNDMAKLAIELKAKADSSFFNTAIVSDNIIETKKKEVDGRAYQIRNGVSSFHSDDLSITSAINQNLSYCFGPNLPLAITEKIAYFSDTTPLDDKSLVITISDYIETISRANLYADSSEITVPKRFIYEANEDRLINSSLQRFFLSIDSWGLSYVVAERCSTAFSENLFDIDHYANQYYQNNSMSVPEVIPETDKSAIFGLYVVDSYSYRSNSDQYAASIYDEASKKTQEILEHYYSIYKDSFFSYKNFSLTYRDDSVSTEEGQRFDFVLRGLSFQNTGMVISRNVAKIICYEVGGYYPFLIMAMPKDTKGLKKLLEIHYQREGTYDGYSIDNNSLSSISSLTNSIFIYKTIFLPVAIVSAVFSFLLLFSYLSASVSDKKKEIGILRALGAKKGDVAVIFMTETIAISMVCYVLSLATLFIASPLINQGLMASSGVFVSVFMPGWRQALILLGISLLVSICSSFFPIRKIAKTSPMSIIRS